MQEIDSYHTFITVAVIVTIGYDYSELQVLLRHNLLT